MSSSAEVEARCVRRSVSREVVVAGEVESVAAAEAEEKEVVVVVDAGLVSVVGDGILALF